jgi:hypothetical protein
MEDIEVHFWIILAHINFVLFKTFWLWWGWKRGFGVDAFDIRKYRSNILSNQM